MQLALLAPDAGPIAAIDTDEIDGSIALLIRLRALSRPLTLARRRGFDTVVANARNGASRVDPGAHRAVLSALDALSLELCDE